MKKRYYFASIGPSIGYIIISLYLTGLGILGFFADELHPVIICCCVFLLISASIVAAWAFFSPSMRIEVDYEKEELYIRHFTLIKHIKFKNIVQIDITDYKKTALEFLITTNEWSKKIVYARYLNRRPSAKIEKVLNDLREELKNISSG